MKELEQQIDDAVVNVIKALRWYDGFHVSDAKHAAQTIFLTNRKQTDDKSKQAIETFGKLINQGSVFTTSGYVRKVANKIKQECKTLSNGSPFDQDESFAKNLVQYFSELTKFIIYLANFNIRGIDKNSGKFKAIVTILLESYASKLFIIFCVLIGGWLGIT